jgi:hypothetical protein
MKIVQLLFLLFIIYLVCVFLYQITRNVMMYKKVEGTITSCEKDTLSFTFIYNRKTYGPFKDNLSELDTCRVGDSYSVKINPLYPSSFTDANTPMLDVLGSMFMVVAILMIVGLCFLYRAIYGKNF